MNPMPAFPGSTPLSEADRLLVQQTLATMRALHSYRFQITTLGDPVRLIGEHVTPDRTHVVMWIGNEQMEQTWLGETRFFLQADTQQWVAVPFDSREAGFFYTGQSLLQFLPGVLGGLLGEEAQQVFVGDELLGDRVTKHFYGWPRPKSRTPGTRLPAEMLLHLVSVWIEPTTHHILRCRVYYPGSGLSMRNGVGQLTFSQETLVLSHFNDPAIVLPLVEPLNPDG